jgi:branched-chain amino acid transport system ATP-binding protein
MAGPSTTAPAHARPLLDVADVTVDFQGLRAIADVSLSIGGGEILGLIGPNGAGKTTLVNVITGFQEPTAGRVVMAGADMAAWKPFERGRRGLARTFQNVLLFGGLSVIENIEAGAIAVGLERSASRARAWQILDWLDLAGQAHRRADTLPFGDERRVGIGRAIAMQPKFLLMDEPAAGLNDAECRGLVDLIGRIRAELGCGILLIEHRMSIVFAVSDRIHVLQQGRTIASGTPDEIRADARVRLAYLGDEAV